MIEYKQYHPFLRDILEFVVRETKYINPQQDRGWQLGIDGIIYKYNLKLTI